MVIEQNELIIDASTKKFEVRKIKDQSILGPIDYGMNKFIEDKNNFCFGKGILAGSKIPGTKRMMFTGLSPLWGNFYISTMGGAAYVFHHLGLNYINIKGKCDKTSVLEMKRQGTTVTVAFYPIDLEEVWSSYKGETGIYALQQYVYDTHGKDFKSCRILATGPAALKTKMGAIASAPIENGKITPVDCWAGRGGIGSKMLQQHGIAAIIYGGDFEELKDSPLNDRDEINEIFEKKFHKNMIQEDIASTIKYRYNPELHSGGTFGVNFTRLKGWMFSFNYQSIYFKEEERIDIHKRFILAHYLKQFNEETIDKKQFKNCGEPCAAVCKKMNGKFKKDYEPYEALGPNIGVFDQRAAEKINHYVDAMGFDAIQAGSLVSWIMECVSKNKFPKEDFDINMIPKWDFKNLDVVSDSKHNADMACQIIDRIINNDKCLVFRKGIRNAAKEIDAKYGTKTINLAVFNAFGKEGCMVPNQYWVPGMFSPMPIMGKYFEYYGADYLNPFELGKKNVERMIKELYSDNSGICRFHRGWVEKLVEKLINELFEENIDYYSHHKKLVQKINLNNQPIFWETERVIDIIKIYLEKVLVGEPNNKELQDLINKFNKDKVSTAKEYWQQVLDGQNEALK
jgi:glyceraldehyde-3-phosphate dehydrogenase (ferredoxin)